MCHIRYYLKTESSLENKANQMKSYHLASSSLFFSLDFTLENVLTRFSQRSSHVNRTFLQSDLVFNNDFKHVNIIYTLFKKRFFWNILVLEPS